MQPATMLTLENEMRSTSSTSKAVKKTATPVAPTKPVDMNEHLGYIAIAAYYKAESRGFAPGHEIEDWLEAEAELETQFATKH